MRLPPSLVIPPSPGGDISNDGLAPFVDRDVFHPHGLSPALRYRFRASTRAVKVRASLLNARSALSC